MEQKIKTVLENYIYPNTFVPTFSPEKPPQINLVELYISDQCQLKCAHCFHGSVRSVDKKLSYSEWCSVIDQFIDLGVKHFHIAGREPFLSIKSVKIMRYLDEKKQTHKIKYGAITNGLFFMKYLPVINNFDIDYLDFSLDGLREGHEFLRGKGSFQQTNKAIMKALQTFGVKKVYVSLAVCDLNASQITAVIDKLTRIGVNRFFIQPIQPIGNAVKLAPYLISAYDYAKLIDLCVASMRLLKNQRNGLIVFIPFPMVKKVCKYSKVARSAIKLYKLNKVAKVDFGNVLIKFRFELQPVAFKKSCVITADGYYINSFKTKSIPNYKDFSLGNVRDNTIRQLFELSVVKGKNLSKQTLDIINSKLRIAYL